MKQFEYLSLGDSQNSQKYLNMFAAEKGITKPDNSYLRRPDFFNFLGKHGWEMVTMTADGKFMFKREIEPEPLIQHQQVKQNQTQTQPSKNPFDFSNYNYGR